MMTHAQKERRGEGGSGGEKVSRTDESDLLIVEELPNPTPTAFAV